MGKVKSVEDIQAVIRDAAELLESTFSGLELRQRMEELEAHHPENPEPMMADDVCPAVAWSAYGDLGHAIEAFAESLESIRRAGSRTVESELQEWKRRNLRRIQDPAAFALLAYLLNLKPIEENLQWQPRRNPP